MGGDRSAQPLVGRGGRNLVDEALARSADEKGMPERFEIADACDGGEALLCRFAEADAGIEHNALPRNTGLCSNLERTRKERGDIRHDVDRWVGGLPVMHDDHGDAVVGDDPRKLAIALQAPYVIDHRRSDPKCPCRHCGLHGVDGDRNAERGSRGHDRGEAPELLGARHRHRAAVRAGRLGTDIQNIGTLRHHSFRLLEGASRIKKTSPVGEGVWGDIEHAHDDWPAEREQAREPVRRCCGLAGATANWPYQRHDRRFAPAP